MTFDLIAPLYDTLSWLVFGRSLQKAQLIFLSDLPPGTSVLLIGGGTGALLNTLLTVCKPDDVLFLEASSVMLAKARRRVRHHPLVGRVRFRHGTERSLLPGETFGAVLLPFVLDVLPEEGLKTRFIPSLLRATQPGSYWLVTDFIPSPRLYHRLLLRTMYGFFRLVAGLETRQLPDWPRLLAEAGLLAGPQQKTAGGQVQTGLWRLIW